MTSNSRSSICWLYAYLVFASAVNAQTFNCGSNGSYGPMNITSSTTLTIPPDGIFHCTTVNIANNVSLSFTRNALNTPVYILATGDVTISGVITVAGKVAQGVAGGIGGPGGFDGGSASMAASIPAGAGGGPGGGAKAVWSSTPAQIVGGGSGAFKTQGAFPASAGSIYGNNLLLPLVGGSGGGGGHSNGTAAYGGGGGGGAILVASNTKIVFVGNNQINANGGGWPDSTNPLPGSGSGGAVRLIAPIITGQASLLVTSAGYGGLGRIRVDAYDYTGLSFSSAGTADSIGTVMVVFPTPLSKLSVSNAAGTAIAENTAGPVSVILPTGTSPTQTIQVRARDFGSVVPIRVRLVPESGDATTFDSTIDNTVNNPATVDVPVTMPINTGVRVEVFTR